ncbi:hypothetical protein ACIA5D_19375 [Actinoplanes sp. NPDC051513]|uniref:hypothetical protein n=1 Tax=Actinoplanes sp. NPDC051513 TaxID=3363908 RepID=UPI0037B7ED7E
MSDGEFHAYAGLLGFCGLGLLALAVLGFGQRSYARVIDGVIGLTLLGGAGYLVVSSVDAGRLYHLVFLAPALLVILLVRERRRARRRRLAAGLLPQMYVAPPPPTPLTPFPAPPPPLGTGPGSEQETPHRSTYQPLPSGLPRKPGPTMPGLSGNQARSSEHRAAGPAPSPSSPSHVEPGLGGVASGPGAPLPGRETFRHAMEPQQAGHDTAAVQETSSRLRRPAYLESHPDSPGGGRHRAADEPEPPEEWPPYRP